jgi:hypothetical protein
MKIVKLVSYVTLQFQAALIAYHPLNAYCVLLGCIFSMEVVSLWLHVMTNQFITLIRNSINVSAVSIHA